MKPAKQNQLFFSPRSKPGTRSLDLATTAPKDPVAPPQCKDLEYNEVLAWVKANPPALTEDAKQQELRIKTKYPADPELFTALLLNEFFYSPKFTEVHTKGFKPERIDSLAKVHVSEAMYEEVLDDNGKPVLDEKSKPILRIRGGFLHAADAMNVLQLRRRRLGAATRLPGSGIVRPLDVEKDEDDVILDYVDGPDNPSRAQIIDKYKSSLDLQTRALAAFDATRSQNPEHVILFDEYRNEPLKRRQAARLHMEHTFQPNQVDDLARMMQAALFTPRGTSFITKGSPVSAETFPEYAGGLSSKGSGSGAGSIFLEDDDAAEAPAYRPVAPFRGLHVSPPALTPGSTPPPDAKSSVAREGSSSPKPRA